MRAVLVCSGRWNDRRWCLVGAAATVVVIEVASGIGAVLAQLSLFICLALLIKERVIKMMNLS